MRAEGEAVAQTSRELRASCIYAALSFVVGLAVGIVAEAHSLPHLGSYANIANGDFGQYVWTLAAEARQLASLSNPLYSPMLWAPRGVNLLDDLSQPLLGALMAPITLTAGPVVSAILLLTFLPALNALAAYLGGRILGFGPLSSAFAASVVAVSPAVLADAFFGHAGHAFSVFLILSLAYFIRYLRTGQLKALALVLVFSISQLLTSTEMFAVMAVAMAVAALSLLATEPSLVIGSVKRSARSACLLSCPFLAAGGWICYYSLLGPAHIVLAGHQWQSQYFYGGADWQDFFILPAEKRGIFVAGAGPLLGLLGIAGALLALRSKALRYLSLSVLILTILATGGSLGTKQALELVFSNTVHPSFASYLLPWYYLGRLPVLRAITPWRMLVPWWWFFGLLSAVTLERLLSALKLRALPPFFAAVLFAAGLGALLEVPTSNLLPFPAQSLADSKALPRFGVAHDPPIALCLPLPGSLPPTPLAPANTQCMVADARASLPVALVGGYFNSPGPLGEPFFLTPPLPGIWGVLVDFSTDPTLATLEGINIGAYRGFLRAHRVAFVVVNRAWAPSSVEEFFSSLCRSKVHKTELWLLWRCSI